MRNHAFVGVFQPKNPGPAAVAVNIVTAGRPTAQIIRARMVGLQGGRGEVVTLGSEAAVSEAVLGALRTLLYIKADEGIVYVDHQGWHQRWRQLHVTPDPELAVAVPFAAALSEALDLAREHRYRCCFIPAIAESHRMAVARKQAQVAFASWEKAYRAGVVGGR